ncbi:hypothetical protein B0H13DRAFT_1869924 [Mycena leptocephala]|nr:hypothetical protein B0H13DRAFT_1869924 [Mycena leptocephala]
MDPTPNQSDDPLAVVAHDLAQAVADAQKLMAIARAERSEAQDALSHCQKECEELRSSADYADSDFRRVLKYLENQNNEAQFNEDNLNESSFSIKPARQLRIASAEGPKFTPPGLGVGFCKGPILSRTKSRAPTWLAQPILDVVWWLLFYELAMFSPDSETGASRASTLGQISHHRRAAFATLLYGLASTSGVTATGPLAFLATWEYKLGAEILTPFGRSQLFNLGVGFRVKYGRMVDSAPHLSAGFFGVQTNQQDYRQVIEIEASDSCALRDLRKSHIAASGTTRALKWAMVYLADARKRLTPYATSLPPSPSGLVAMQQLCAYERHPTVLVCCGHFGRRATRPFHALSILMGSSMAQETPLAIAATPACLTNLPRLAIGGHRAQPPKDSEGSGSGEEDLGLMLQWSHLVEVEEAKEAEEVDPGAAHSLFLNARARQEILDRPDSEALWEWEDDPLDQDQCHLEGIAGISALGAEEWVARN